MDLDGNPKPEQPRTPVIQDYFRACLCSPNGLYVLRHILLMCHFWGELDPNDPAQIAEYNIGQKIMAMCAPPETDEHYGISVLQALTGLRRS
jgi:hypothetical protein